ncbi:hypothetical protein HK101_008930 [Irineochytrium annulatum]|nr:hypothetical protein HK101_008930 [Irineochytrium annulatum]
MRQVIYLTLLNSPPFSSLPAAPSTPTTAFSHFLLLGSREVFNLKLHLQVRCVVPVEEATLPNVLASHIGTRSENSILGFGVTAPFINTILTVETIASNIATHFFDNFTTQLLRALAVNCPCPLSTPDQMRAFSREACAMLQDCVGLVSLMGDRFAGKGIMMAFEGNVLQQDIEARTRALFDAGVVNGVRQLSGEQGGSTTPAKVHQLPHSALHVLPGPTSGFISKVFGADSLLRPADADVGSVPDEFRLDGGVAAMEDEVIESGAREDGDFSDLPQPVRGRCEEVMRQLEVTLPAKMDLHEASYRELEDMTLVAELLAKITADDIARAVAAET